MTRATRVCGRVSAGLAAIVVMASLGMAPARPVAAATTLTVTTTADLAPPCVAASFSLRCAITQANTDASGDSIAFHIPAAAPGCAGTPAVCTMRPRHALPALTASNTTIDGYTQPGAAPNTNTLDAGDNAVLTVRLDGSLAGTGVDGLVLLGARDTVKGLSITGFQTCFAPSPGCNGIPGSQMGGSGVRINGAGDAVAGSFLGVTPDGKTPGANQFAGVDLGPAQVARLDVPDAASTALSDTVGGATPEASNVLSGNRQCTVGDCEGFGVYLNAGNGSVVARNYIGTNAAGTSPLSNTATAVVILSARTVLAGNVISGNGGDAVLVGGAGNMIVGNKIGTNAAGSAALGNGSHGLDVQAANNVIRGNVISANGDTGLVLLGTGNVVQGNRVGTDASGAIALGNGFHPSAIFLGQPINGTDGIVVCAGPNMIGGTAAGAGNLVSGNAGDGISLVSSGNVVQGNNVGTNASGTAALPNRVDGIGSRSDVFKGTGFCQQAPNTSGNNNTIGGAAAGAGNIVGGNAGDGVVVLGTGNTVAGNRIGATAAITAVLGNGGNGIVLTAFCEDGVCSPSSNNMIGGTAAGAGNVVSGNRGNGVLIDGTGGGVSNAVQGNTIGGTVALGNGANGVVLENGAVGDNIGGTAVDAGNLIAHNGGAGVLIGATAADTATHSAVQRNAIFANGGLGIDLAPRGVVNCATPAPGPNDYTPCPLIQAASTTAISGTACNNCTVEVYLASNEPDDQGHGEGQRLLGSVTAGANGAWSLALAAGQVSAGQRVTASAATPVAFGVAAETSEFAANVQVGSS